MLSADPLEEIEKNSKPESSDKNLQVLDSPLQLSCEHAQARLLKRDG